MNFDLSEEQKMLHDTVRRFFETEVPSTRLLEIYNEDTKLDRDLWNQSAELGLTGLLVPEEYGGLGLELLDIAVVADAMGYCAAPGPLLGHVLMTLALVTGGSDEQKEKWLPLLASGELVGSIALGEEGDIWQPDQWTLTPTDGSLSGIKKNVLFPSDADLFLVGLEGGRFAIVERDSAGVTTLDWDGVDRTRRIGELTLDNAAFEVLPGDNSVAEQVRDAGLILLAADAYGGAHRSVELTVDYTSERVQFGKTIAHFQGIKHQIADAASEVEPARALVWYAAYAFDHRPDEVSRLAAVAKAHLTERFINASRTMVMLHGGIGYTWEFHCQFWLKRAMFDRNYLGSPSLHRERAAVLAGW